MRLVVNGTEREVSDGLTVAELVQQLDASRADGRGLAVAVDAQVVPHSDWEGARLADGQRVEVVGAIQGG
jgi:sulfur carrier protein